MRYTGTAIQSRISPPMRSEKTTAIQKNKRLTGVACKKDGYAKKKDDEYDRDVRVVQKRRRYRGVQESEHARNRVGAHDIKTLRLPRGYIHTASSFREQKSDGIEM